MTCTATGFCVAAAFVSVVGVAAQSAKPAPRTGDAARDPKTLTLTGCLQQGADSATYTLTNVAVDPGASATGGKSATAGTSGGAAAAAGSAATTTDVWTIVPAKVDLKPHVGHRVQVTGAATGEPAGSAMKSETKAAGTGQTAAGTVKSEQSAKGELIVGAHKLTVTTVKHIAETCGR
jgi:hypothetical protein